MSRNKYKIDEIRARRAWLADRLEEKGESIARRWDELVAPGKKQRGAGKWMSRFATALTLYDGAMMGYRIYRGLNRVFRRRK